MVRHISENEFESEVLNEEGIVVVDFFAQWCGPCRMLAPVLDEVQIEMQDVKIVKVDVDQNPITARQYGVQSIPTIKVFKNGEEVKTEVGYLPKALLIHTIKTYM